MPAVSEKARVLINNLVEVGSLLGYEAKKEAPIFEGSFNRVDILWKGRLQKNIPFPTPNIYSIEVQYSDAPTSIGFNMWKAEKTLHPAVHIVISYNKLADNFRELIHTYYPRSGVAVFEGEEQIAALNEWIGKIVQERDQLKQVQNAEGFMTFLKEKEAKLKDEIKKVTLDLWLERLFEPVLYEISVVSTYLNGTRSRTFFLTGPYKEVIEKAIEYFKKTMNDDTPFELDGECIHLKRLEITCYEFVGYQKAQPKIKKDAAYKVVVNTLTGRDKDVRLEMTDSRFGTNSDYVKENILKDLKLEIERMSNPREIINQEVYFGTYIKVKSWKKAINGEIILSSNENPTKEQQVEKMRRFFFKEFGLGVEAFLSLNDISDKKDYRENLEDIREQLRYTFERYPKDFYDRMKGIQVMRFTEWLDEPFR